MTSYDIILCMFLILIESEILCKRIHHVILYTSEWGVAASTEIYSSPSRTVITSTKSTNASPQTLLPDSMYTPQTWITYPANMRHSPNVGLMLGQRRVCDAGPALIQHWVNVLCTIRFYSNVREVSRQRLFNVLFIVLLFVAGLSTDVTCYKAHFSLMTNIRQ